MTKKVRSYKAFWNSKNIELFLVQDIIVFLEKHTLSCFLTPCEQSKLKLTTHNAMQWLRLLCLSGLNLMEGKLSKDI